MRVLLTKFSGLTLLALLVTSCSIQKRTVLPGFHMERMHKASLETEWNSHSRQQVEGMTSLGCALPPPASSRRGIGVQNGLDIHPPHDMVAMSRVLPKQVEVNLRERDLQEPQPWEKEAKTQSLFGVISLVSFCLGAILMAMGTLHPLPFLLAMVALLMKKIQANKVLDLMEAHGMDDGKTRREQRQEQRRESKSLWRTALKTVLLAIAALALILAIDNALVFSVTL